VVCGQRRRTRERQICLPGCCHHGSERFRKMGRAINPSLQLIRHFRYHRSTFFLSTSSQKLLPLPEPRR
jgi:hypothetical protein